MEEIIRVVLQEGWFNFIWKPAAHFISSGLVGLLVYWLTLTTLSRSSSGTFGSHRLLKGESGMHHFSFYLALLFAVWFHLLEDFTLNWF